MDDAGGFGEFNFLEPAPAALPSQPATLPEPAPAAIPEPAPAAIPGPAPATLPEPASAAVAAQEFGAGLGKRVLAAFIFPFTGVIGRSKKAREKKDAGTTQDENEMSGTNQRRATL